MLSEDNVPPFNLTVPVPRVLLFDAATVPLVIIMSAEKFDMLVSLNTNVPFPVFEIEYELEFIGASILYTALFVIL